MQTRNKIVYLLVACAAIAAVAGSFYRFVIARDFLVEQQVWCDAETEEGCFYFVCQNDWWTPCTGDPAIDIWVYKTIQKPYHNIAEGLFAEPCVPGETIGEDEFCPEIACEEGEEDCIVTYCDPSIDDNCYTSDKMAEVDALWLERITAAGIEPILPEDEPLDEGELEAPDGELVEDEALPVEEGEGEMEQ